MGDLAKYAKDHNIKFFLFIVNNQRSHLQNAEFFLFPFRFGKIYCKLNFNRRAHAPASHF